MKVRQFYKYARKILTKMDEKCFLGEINTLLETYLNLNFTKLILSKERDLTKSEFESLEKALTLRKNGTPLQYILGYWNFMGNNFEVGSGVLIPREDTTTLVNLVLKYARLSKNPKIIDLCSGSGIVAISIEKNLSNCEIFALEYSDRAFEYLSKNIKNLNSKTKAIRADVFKNYNQFKDNTFDFIVSNPPYIKTDDIKSLEKEVLKEPFIALDGGKDGLEFYKGICKFWIPKLKKGGRLAFEIGKDMFFDVKSIMTQNGIENIEFENDINGIIRSIIGIKK